MSTDETLAQLQRLAALLALRQGGQSEYRAYTCVQEMLTALELEFLPDRENGRFLIGLSDGNRIDVLVRPACCVQVYVKLGAQVPPQYRSAAARHVCAINFGLSVGNFELDFRDGEVRFKCSFVFEPMPDDSALQSAFLQTLKLAHSTFDTHESDFRAIARGEGPAGPGGSPHSSGGAAAALGGGGGSSSGGGGGGGGGGNRSSASVDLANFIRSGHAVSADDVLTHLNRGADANRASSTGFTPLMAAAARDLPEVCRVLVLNGGANMGVRNNNNDSALSLAVYLKKSAAAVALIELGHEASRPDKYGDTPMLDACKHGLLDVVRALLQRGGVDLRHKNQAGKTALALAMDNGHQAIMQLLLRSGATV